MITLQSIGAALHHALMIRRKAEQEEAAFLERKRVEREALGAEQAAERQRYADYLADKDGSRAAAKAAREEEMKQERLDFLAAQFANIETREEREERMKQDRLDFIAAQFARID